LRVFLF